MEVKALTGTNTNKLSSFSVKDILDLPDPKTAINDVGAKQGGTANGFQSPAANGRT